MKYEEAAKRWAEKKLRQDKITFVKVTYVGYEVETDGGCPTCGPETKIVASISYTTTNGITPAARKTYDYWGLGDLLTELFEASE